MSVYIYIYVSIFRQTRYGLAKIFESLTDYLYTISFKRNIIIVPPLRNLKVSRAERNSLSRLELSSVQNASIECDD